MTEPNTVELNYTPDLSVSEVFVCLLDQSTLEDARCYVEMLIAKTTKKPMFYIVPKDLDIPKEYIDGVEHLHISRIEKATATAKEAINEVMGELNAFIIELEGKGILSSE